MSTGRVNASVCCAALIGLLLCAGHAVRAEVKTLDTRDFAGWEYPKGLVRMESDGVKIRRFGGPYNAVSDIDSYSVDPVGVHGTEKLRTQSREDQVANVADLDPATYWQPDPEDPVNRWWFELDLGRLVAADQIKLIFPDTEDAQPFQFFSVYVSRGLGLRVSPGQIEFRRVGRPVSNNTRTEVEFDLNIVESSVATAEYLVTQDTLGFDLVRFVRFEAAGQNPGAALAEIQVRTVGFNLCMRVNTEERAEADVETWGGRAWTSNARDCSGCGKAFGAEGLVDGNITGEVWSVESAAADDWRSWGHWGVVDLGSVFRVERIVWVPIIAGISPFLYGFDEWRQGDWKQTDFLVSDGTPSSVSDPEVEGPYEYEILTQIDNSTVPRRNFYDLQFPPREVRLVMFRRMELAGSWAKAVQLLVYPAEGYPAQVTFESPDIDLGGAFSVRRLEWDADLPQGTGVEVQTQTGNGYQTITRYFLANGVEVTEAEYEAAKPRHRGDVIQDEVRDASWSNWSPPHVVSGQDFQSPTPRRWIKLRVRLTSADAEAMPLLRSLSLVMNSPVVSSGVTGELTPRTAALDSLQEFVYVLAPNELSSRDEGFDQAIIMVPPEAEDTDLVGVSVGGEAVAAAAELRSDSLYVTLDGAPVRGDTVVVTFRTRLFRSPTVFTSFVGNSSQEGNLQGVTPASRGATEVYVPQVVESSSLFQKIQYTKTVTPNADGVNEQLVLSFNVIKTGREPSVRVYSLRGREVAELQSTTPVSGRARYVWNGRDDSGNMVPPGIYLVRMEIETDARDEVQHRLVHVVH